MAAKQAEISLNEFIISDWGKDEKGNSTNLQWDDSTRENQSGIEKGKPW